MIYREWFSLRLKLLLWSVIYFGAVVVFLASHVWFIPMVVSIYQQDDGLDIYNTLFGEWLPVISMLTPVLALIGAIDLVSEETSRNIISFILTRPFTRTRIYATKMLLTTGALVVISGVSSLIILLVDQMPRQVLILHWTTNSCGENAYCSGWNGDGNALSRPAEIVPALVALGVVLAVGVLVICGTGLLSIFTKSMLQTAAAALPFVLIMYLLLNGNGPFARVSQYQPMTTEVLNWAEVGPRLEWLAGLSIAGTLAFLIGLVVFKRKEF